MVYRGQYSYRQEARIITPFPNTFFVLFLHFERVCKSFERTQVAHLHNAGLVGVFNCQQISFINFDIVVKNKSNLG